MRSINKIISKFLFSIIATLAVTNSIAQETGATAATPTSSNNLLEILMGVIALVLAFVIWGMGQVLVTIGRQALEKSKKQNSLDM